jgi:hypothetical protein
MRIADADAKPSPCVSEACIDHVIQRIGIQRFNPDQQEKQFNVLYYYRFAVL